MNGSYGSYGIRVEGLQGLMYGLWTIAHISHCQLGGRRRLLYNAHVKDYDWSLQL